MYVFFLNPQLHCIHIHMKHFNFFFSELSNKSHSNLLSMSYSKTFDIEIAKLVTSRDIFDPDWSKSVDKILNLDDWISVLIDSEKSLTDWKALFDPEALSANEVVISTNPSMTLKHIQKFFPWSIKEVLYYYLMESSF
jgi:hypothetical protein